MITHTLFAETSMPNCSASSLRTFFAEMVVRSLFCNIRSMTAPYATSCAGVTRQKISIASQKNVTEKIFTRHCRKNYTTLLGHAVYVLHLNSVAPSACRIASRRAWAADYRTNLIKANSRRCYGHNTCCPLTALHMLIPSLSICPVLLICNASRVVCDHHQP